MKVWRQFIIEFYHKKYLVTVCCCFVIELISYDAFVIEIYCGKYFFMTENEFFIAENFYNQASI